jgi:Outer membrane protein beta-barrel domain
MRNCPRALLLVLWCACLLVAWTARAQDDEGEEIDRTRSGFYFSPRGLYAFDFFNIDGTRAFARSNIQPSFGIDARLGYRLTPIFAVEGQFEWLSDFTLTGPAVYSSGGVTRPRVKVEGLTGGVAGKAYLPLGAVQPYALVGVGALNAHTSTQGAVPLSRYQTGAAFRGGLGADLYGFGSDDFALTAEADYVAGVGDVEWLHYLSVNFGFLWRW